MTELHLSSNKYYKVDPLYQWDQNQELKIYGVTVSQPIIHFTNSSMGASINRRPAVDSAGVLAVMIPNSMLQKTDPVIAYICGYVGDAFKTFYKLEIPIISRKKPGDYTIEVADDEIYSFNKLENKVVEAVAEYEEKYQNILNRVTTCETTVSTCESKVTKYEKEFEAVKEYVGNYADRLNQMTEDIATAKTYDYRKPWNIDADVGSICDEKFSVKLESNTAQTHTVAMPMINSGTVLLSFSHIMKSASQSSAPVNSNYIILYLNDDIVFQDITVQDTYQSAITEVIELTVNQGDILTLNIGTHNTNSSYPTQAYVSDFQILANIDTAYQYKQAFASLENPSTTDVINTLLGV